MTIITRRSLLAGAAAGVATLPFAHMPLPRDA